MQTSEIAQTKSRDDVAQSKSAEERAVDESAKGEGEMERVYCNGISHPGHDFINAYPMSIHSEAIQEKYG